MVVVDMLNRILDSLSEAIMHKMQIARCLSLTLHPERQGLSFDQVLGGGLPFGSYDITSEVPGPEEYLEISESNISDETPVMLVPFGARAYVPQSSQSDSFESSELRSRVHSEPDGEHRHGGPSSTSDRTLETIQQGNLGGVSSSSGYGQRPKRCYRARLLSSRGQEHPD